MKCPLSAWCSSGSWAGAHFSHLLLCHSSGLLAAVLCLAQRSRLAVCQYLGREMRCQVLYNWNVFIIYAVCSPLLVLSQKQGAKGKAKESSFPGSRTYPWSIPLVSLYSHIFLLLGWSQHFLIVQFTWCVAHIYCRAGKYLLMQSSCSSLPLTLAWPGPSSSLWAAGWLLEPCCYPRQAWLASLLDVPAVRWLHHELLAQLCQGDAVPCCHRSHFIQGVNAVIHKAVKS